MILDELVPNHDFEIEPASQGQRLAHFVIDGVVLFAIHLFFNLFLFRAFLGVGLPLSNLFILLVYLFLLSFSYYFLTEALFGKTVGKMVNRTKVVGPDGFTAPTRQLFVRTLCRYIPADPFTFLGNNKQGLHDRLSDTLVVKDNYK